MPALFSDLTAGPKVEAFIGEIWRIQSADVLKSNVATVQDFFGNLNAIDLDANTAYYFEMLAFLTRSAGVTNHNTSISFGGTATFSGIKLVRASDPTTNALGAPSEITMGANTAITVTAANASANEEFRIEVKAIIRCTVAGTFIPQFNYSTAPGGAPSVRNGSYCFLRRLGVDTVQNIN